MKSSSDALVNINAGALGLTASVVAAGIATAFIWKLIKKDHNPAFSYKSNYYQYGRAGKNNTSNLHIILASHNSNGSVVVCSRIAHIQRSKDARSTPENSLDMCCKLKTHTVEVIDEKFRSEYWENIRFGDIDRFAKYTDAIRWLHIFLKLSWYFVVEKCLSVQNIPLQPKHWDTIEKYLKFTLSTSSIMNVFLYLFFNAYLALVSYIRRERSDRKWRSPVESRPNDRENSTKIQHWCDDMYTTHYLLVGGRGRPQCGQRRRHKWRENFGWHHQVRRTYISIRFNIKLNQNIPSAVHRGSNTSPLALRLTMPSQWAVFQVNASRSTPDASWEL